MIWYTLLVGLVILERIAELVIAERNRRWSLARGGIESGQAHYPVMVVLHTGLLAGALAEVHWLDRGFTPWLGWPLVAVVAAAQALRWWCIRTLGRQWTTRVVVVPGMPKVTDGPYSYLRHPNYLAVVVEGLALPLVHGAWLTAVVFTTLNLPLLWRRIAVEQRALATLTGSAPPSPS